MIQTLNFQLLDMEGHTNSLKMNYIALKKLL